MFLTRENGIYRIMLPPENDLATPGGVPGQNMFEAHEIFVMHPGATTNTKKMDLGCLVSSESQEPDLLASLCLQKPRFLVPIWESS